MSTRAFSLVASMALVLVVVACGGGSTTTSLLGNGSEPGSASSSTDPTDPTDSTASAPKSGALGAACSDYVACCDLIATTAPQLAAGCDAFKTQFDKATASGVSASTFESSCQSSVATLKSAGYCKPAVEKQKCVPSCTTDADCANSCEAVPGGSQCCDLHTMSCWASKTSSCPKPEDAGVQPPPAY
ncbi:MAG: hypothetical protein QOI41_4927 [Myxococcales bacterium]|nr:hypothetical protein [Myxococcales bacterium]